MDGRIRLDYRWTRPDYIAAAALTVRSRIRDEDNWGSVTTIRGRRRLRGRLSMESVPALNLVRFVRQSVRSVWALDLLLLMRRPPVRSWQPAELVAELRASDAVIAGALDSLEREGLVRKEDGRVRFAPVAEALEELTDALAAAYAERPVAVINAIFAPDDDLKALAEAFRFTPPKR